MAGHKTKYRLEQMKQQVAADFKFVGASNRSLIKFDIDESVALGDPNCAVKIDGNPAGGAFVGLGINKLLVQAAGVADDDFLRIAGTVIEGRSGAEVIADLSLEAGVDIQAQDDGLQYLADLTITNEATFQEQTGLEIGVDVEPHSDKLTELAMMDQATADAMADLLAAEVIFMDGASSANSVASKAAILDGSGHLVLNSKQLQGLADPTAAQHGATKAYVDSVANGLDVKQSVIAATISDIAGTYNAGSGTITAGSNGALGAQDGVTMTAGQRLLVKNQTDHKQNGIYVVTAVGDGSNPYVLTRATDFDASGSAEVSTGAFTFVEQGTDFADQGFVMSNHEFVELNDASGNAGKVQWSQFSGAGQITAGNGLEKLGNEIKADLKANSGLVIDSAEISLDLSASGITGTLAVSDGGSGQASFTDGEILIGNTTGNTLAKATLTGGDGVAITNGNGSISLAVDLVTDSGLEFSSNKLRMKVADNSLKINASNAGFSAKIKSAGGVVVDAAGLKIDLAGSAVEGVTRFSGASQKHSIIHSGGQIAADGNFAIADDGTWVASDFEAALENDREIYLNGQLLLEDTNVTPGAGNMDWYEKSTGVLAFEFPIENDDIITMVYRKV